MAPPLEEVRIGYFANLTHAQAVLGIASGEFAQALAPTKVTPMVFNAGPDLIEALNSGRVDVAYVGPGPVLSAYTASRGESIRVIAGAEANGVVIVAAKDSGIHRMEDLAGKRVATPQLGNTQDISARHYMTQTLHQSDADNVLAIANSEQASMMARGKIDAAWVPEPWGARLIAETGATLIAEEKDLWPHKKFTLTVVATTPEFLAQHPDVIEKILAVHHRWTLRLQQSPEAQVGPLEDALATLTKKRLPDGVVAAAMTRTLFTDDPLPETFKTMAQWSFDLQFIHRQQNLDQLIDTTILNKVTGSAPAAMGGGN